MRIPLRIALALGLAGVLAACTDESTSTPTGPIVPRAIPSAKTALNMVNVVCDASVLKGYARIYAAKANDPLFTFLGNIASALKADGNTPGAASTKNAFDALAQVAKIRGTSAQNSGATGTAFDKLVHGLLRCMPDAVLKDAVEPTDPRGTGFAPALLAGWVFEVRGGTGDPSGGAYERGAGTPAGGNWWAARPLTGQTWAQAINPDPAGPLPDRVLIYGYRTDPASGQLGSSFLHFSIPKIARTPAPTDVDPFTIQATLGLCFADKGVFVGKTPRVNHANKFLSLTNQLDTECEAPGAFTAVGSLAATSPLNPIMLAKRAVKFFAPHPLYAATAMFDGGGSVTGTPDDWSPSAVWDLSKFELGKIDSITDGRISDQIHYAGNTPGGVPVTFKVNIAGTGSATLPPDPAPDGTPVTVSVVGNQSVIAFFDDGGVTGPTATRLVSGGQVSFAGVKLIKAGGYKIAFRVSFDQFSGPVTNSNAFNIQGK